MFLEAGKGGIIDIASSLKIKNHELAQDSLVIQEEIRNKVIAALEILRKELGHKVREIKRLSNDFRSDLVKESQVTQKLLTQLSESLTVWATAPNQITARQDPYLCHLEVSRQLKRQIDEENYLHRAFLNLEKSGRALEEVVVTTIQQTFITYRSINEEYGTIPHRFLSSLMDQMAYLTTDIEWENFLNNSESDLIHPDVKIRSVEDLDYIGKDSLGIRSLRSGALERKTKYLRSWSNGSYVLTATGFLHEFKKETLDYTPVMSFFIPDCTLGKHTEPNQKDQSHKFVLNGSKTGGLHRGHSWIFRAENHDQMIGWYQALFRVSRFSSLAPAARQSLISCFNSPSEAHYFVILQKPSLDSSNDFEETDEADAIPFASTGHFIEHLEEPPRLAGGSFANLDKVSHPSRRQSISSLSSATSSHLCKNKAAPASQHDLVAPTDHTHTAPNSPQSHMSSLQVVVPPPVQVLDQTSEEENVKEPAPAESIDLDLVVENIMTGAPMEEPQVTRRISDEPTITNLVETEQSVENKDAIDSDPLSSLTSSPTSNDVVRPTTIRSDSVFQEISTSLVGRYPPNTELGAT
ncbi:Phosphatidylinositol 4,5-bisphosphate-binding protein SLM2 [Neolecta irregularis DAH-3]|uniref:Phosphatidylinositol 4,5-bisphosphate-binding protein SLM2 n=1 Tax=Neolecta irregularis (strain DAH-3) TaxID=1198029 RepID=A0A1U7LGS5_NEOID|nr:Phosphatidylinositol 4,5-bisphosphate-binding protein SLM2 [Neolecta irregularis DAH-3]|eukprot:OLL21854.1 Phosphatidylinositol 4,5-bisphosphate-binding protein SLM2 [Neolecta irregularis DAH-3]